MATVYYHPSLVPQLTELPLGSRTPTTFKLGSVSCTCAAGAVAQDRNSRGNKLFTMKQIRKATGDTVDGTNVGQVDEALAKLVGADNLSTAHWRWEHVAKVIAEEGRGFLWAVRYRKILEFMKKQKGSPQKELIGGIEHGFGDRVPKGGGPPGDADWHALLAHMWLAQGETVVIHGKTLEGPATERGLVVFDSLCDGRRSTVAEGPVVYPQSLVRAIVADSLLAGRTYGAFTNDARIDGNVPPDKQHPNKRILRYGGEPVHRRFRTVGPSWFRSSPRRDPNDPRENTVRWLPAGEVLELFQRTNQGSRMGGSRRWFGNRTGDLWIHVSRLEKL